MIETKHKYPFTLDLQMFADVEVPDADLDTDEPDLSDIEVERDDTPAGDDSVDIPDADESDDETESKEKPGTSEQERTVSLKALQAERDKWKQRLADANRKAALADKMMQHAGVSDLEAFQQQLDALEAQRHIDQGVDPAYAQQLVRQQRQLADMQKQMNKQKYDVQVQQLKQNPFYADVEDVRDELEDIAERTGLTLEQAYMAVRGPQRMQEYETQVTQRVLNNQAKKQSKKLDTSASGDPKTTPKVKLTSDELAIAKMAGMSPEEYYKAKLKG